MAGVRPARHSRPVSAAHANATLRAWPVAGQAPGAASLFALLVTLLAEPALEPGDTAARVEDLLLAGVERVAVGADIGVDLSVLRRAASRKGVTAGAGHLGHHIIGVNVPLHQISWFPRSPGRHAGKTRGREPVPHLSAYQCATASTGRLACRFPLH